MIGIYFVKESGEEEMWFNFQKTKYIYDAMERKQFYPLSFPDDHSIKHYMDWRGYQDEGEMKAAESMYGPNK